MQTTQKKIIIFTGPNGAGKTTFANEYWPNEASISVFVNADLIAASIEPARPENAAFRAGRLMLEKLNALAAQEENFAFETTLAGRCYVKKIYQWRVSNYHVHLVFLSLETPQKAVHRVAHRVRMGGHHIPEDTIHRRFHAGLANFRDIYCGAVDTWRLYNNDSDQPILLEQGDNR